MDRNLLKGIFIRKPAKFFLEDQPVPGHTHRGLLAVEGLATTGQSPNTIYQKQISINSAIATMYKRDSGVALNVKHALSYQTSGIRNQDTLAGAMANQKSPQYEIQEVDSMIEMESLIEDGMFSVASMDPKTSSFELRRKQNNPREEEEEEGDQIMGTSENNLENAIQKFGSRHIFYNKVRRAEEQQQRPEMAEDRLPTPFNRSSDS